LLSIETYKKLGDGFNYEHDPSKLASYASIKNLRPLRDLNPQIPPQYLFIRDPKETGASQFPEGVIAPHFPSETIAPLSKIQHSKNRETLVQYSAVMKLCPEA